jgi:hypothetical protein
MNIDFTPIAKPYFKHWLSSEERKEANIVETQSNILRYLLKSAQNTLFGQEHEFSDILNDSNLYESFISHVPPTDYENIRPYVMRMIHGESDILWRGVCRNFAQSSGTSGSKSKFIPITDDSLRLNHYAGGTRAVASYLKLTPESHIFAGKGLILGGSFANEVTDKAPKTKIGDLSATLIDKINPLVNLFRVPDKKTALLPDWEEKLPLLAEKAANADVTNISGVPSWFLILLQRIMDTRQTDNISNVWQNLEVFFHGGISFAPYREEYKRIISSSKMHYLETYNASEGFFGVQTDYDDSAMQLLIADGIFYELRTLDGNQIIPLQEATVGETYELMISAPNGLWRYSPGDTVKVHSTNPFKITVAGRTKSFINAFGEEVMECNTEAAIAEASKLTNASVANYTVAPVYASDGKRGYHQWLIEWHRQPSSIAEFASILDHELQKLNSDYQAKRSHDIFLAPLEIITSPKGLFDQWLASSGSGKLGGQRKIARLSNNRAIMDKLLSQL